jgi:hypothetical protein
MVVLKKMAKEDNTSVAGVIRKALHTVIFRTHPDLAIGVLEREVDTFLADVGSRLPQGGVKGAQRSRLKNRLVKELIGGRK